MPKRKNQQTFYQTNSGLFGKYDPSNDNIEENAKFIEGDETESASEYGSDSRVVDGDHLDHESA